MARGTHIGMRTTSKEMRKFVFQIKRNRIAVIDLDITDARIEKAANLLSKYPPEKILVVSRKETGFKPVLKFSEITGSKAIYGRFLPGTLTNPNSPNFIEPEIMVITDPVEDKQAIIEAKKANIPVIGICNTGNDTSYIDFIIPANNLGKRSIGLIYFLLARELMKKRGKIKEDKDFKYKIDDFVMNG